jgi:acyl phosphate:glycerol-3-phosphate acyltransferase
MWMSTAVSIVISYLLGSISFSYLFARLLKGIDIREHGSGNAGATNTLRVLGKGPAVLVLLLDVAKGAAAVGVGYWFTQDPTIMMICGMSAVAGHNWPIFLKFRGGKGIATTIGVMAILVFYAALIAGIAAILSIVFSRYVSLGSLIFTAGLPLSIFALGTYPPSYFWLSLIFAVFAFWRHKDNIVRLIKGQERKIQF